MAPNPRVKGAFNAMKAIGITESKVKPVLKRLLKLYEKKWELIEEENYRALADAIFEEEDNKGQEEGNASETFEEEDQVPDETERPLKRLRRGKECTVASSSLDNRSSRLDGTSLRKPKVEEDELPYTNSMQQIQDNRKLQPVPASPQKHHATHMGKLPALDIPLKAQGSSNLSQLCAIDRTVPSDSLLRKQHSYKGKEPMLPQVSPRDKRPNLDRASAGVRFKDPIVDPDSVLKPKQACHDTHVLIKPKDEPFTDGTPLNDILQSVVPIAVIPPVFTDSSSREDSVLQSVPMGKPDGQEPSHLTAGEDRDDGVPAFSQETRDNNEPLTVPDQSRANLEIASSSLGEVKISLNCNSMLGRPNFCMPSKDELLRSMQEKCLQAYKITDPNFSVMQMLKDMCECFLDLATESSQKSQERLLNVEPAIELLKKSSAYAATGVGSEENGLMPGICSKGSVNVHSFAETDSPHVPRLIPLLNSKEDAEFSKKAISESCSLVTVPQCQLTPEEIRSLHGQKDISKGEEVVEIPWLNEINDKILPLFNYIPQNLVFQNACVKFTLSQIKAENFCSCIADCLSSSKLCICTNETGCGPCGFAYTSEGLVKEDFLEDCISMAHDSQRQCLMYCTDCPLERSKNDEMLDCKGHLKRKYIKECWRKCGCHKQCGNRVVQRGIRCKLQVFLTPEGKGWGLRTLEKLPKGAFVCEYVGEILTNKEMHERSMQRKRSTNSERYFYPPVLDAYWSVKGIVKDEEALCLDATFYGNVARFINHRCFDANLIEIPVKIEIPDHHYYHLAFFTTREVNPLEELTWDYGIDFDDNDLPIEVFRCRCGSKFCRNVKRSPRSISASR